MGDFEDAFDFTFLLFKPIGKTKQEQPLCKITQSAALALLKKDLEDELERDYFVRCARYSTGKTASSPSKDTVSEMSSSASSLFEVPAVNAK